MRVIGRWLWLLVIAGVMLIALGCTAPAPTGATPRFAASTSSSANGLSVSVFVSKTQIEIADRLDVLIEVSRDDGAAIVWPAILASVERGGAFPRGATDADSGTSDWTIVDVSRRTLAPGHETLELVLEPYLDGDKPIPAFAFGNVATTLTTEAISVKVVAEHIAADAGSTDPLAAVAALGAPLPASIPKRPWLRDPMVWGISAAAGILLLGGAVGIVGLRWSRRHSVSADGRFEAEVLQLRARITASGPADAPAIAEATNQVFRRWLAETSRLAPGATSTELVAWLRASIPGSMLADRLNTMEHQRFGPGGAITQADALELINLASGTTAELRRRSMLKASEGRQN